MTDSLFYELWRGGTGQTQHNGITASKDSDQLMYRPSLYELYEGSFYINYTSLARKSACNISYWASSALMRVVWNSYTMICPRVWEIVSWYRLTKPWYSYHLAYMNTRNTLRSSKHGNDGILTSVRRDYVTLTSVWCHFGVMCLWGQTGRGSYAVWWFSLDDFQPEGKLK